MEPTEIKRQPEAAVLGYEEAAEPVEQPPVVAPALIDDNGLPGEPVTEVAVEPTAVPAITEPGAVVAPATPESQPVTDEPLPTPGPALEKYLYS